MNTMGTIKGKILGGFFSSTMWFGFLLMLGNWLNNNTAMIQGMFPSEYSELVLYIVGLLIWFFRWITSKPVQDKIPGKVTDDGVDATTRLNDALADEDPNHT